MMRTPVGQSWYLDVMATDTVSDVIQVCVALGTLGLAAFAAWTLRQDHLRRAEAHRADTRAQASLVAAWFGHFQGDSPNIMKPDDTPLVSGIVEAIVVRNGSTLPVWDVQATYVMPDGVQGAIVPVRRIAVVPPGEDRAIPKSQALSTVDGARLRIRISFRDAQGLTWARDEDGILIES